MPPSTPPPLPLVVSRDWAEAFVVDPTRGGRVGLAALRCGYGDYAAAADEVVEVVEHAMARPSGSTAGSMSFVESELGRAPREGVAVMRLGGAMPRTQGGR